VAGQVRASETAAREKAIRVIENLRGLRLTRVAELAETEVEETLTYYAFLRSIGGVSAPTIRSSGDDLHAMSRNTARRMTAMVDSEPGAVAEKLLDLFGTSAVVAARPMLILTRSTIQDRDDEVPLFQVSEAEGEN
jgi:hypothetical protein